MLGVLRACQRGLGIAMLPDYLVEENGGLVQLFGEADDFTLRRVLRLSGRTQIGGAHAGVPRFPGRERAALELLTALTLRVPMADMHAVCLAEVRMAGMRRFALCAGNAAQRIFQSRCMAAGCRILPDLATGAASCSPLEGDCRPSRADMN